MDLADGLGILPGTGRVGLSLVVALGRCGGVAVAVSWIFAFAFSLASDSIWLPLPGPHGCRC